VDRNGVTFVISLIVVAVVVLNLFGKGLDNADQILKEIVLILAGAFGNEAIRKMSKDTSNDSGNSSIGSDEQNS